MSSIKREHFGKKRIHQIFLISSGTRHIYKTMQHQNYSNNNSLRASLSLIVVYSLSLHFIYFLKKKRSMFVRYIQKNPLVGRLHKNMHLLCLHAPGDAEFVVLKVKKMVSSVKVCCRCVNKLVLTSLNLYLSEC